METIRRIIHLDLDAFFCAVEELQNPSLKGKPFAVGGSPEGRGVIASCNYAARSYGIHSAMPAAQALRLCPSLILVGHGFGGYSRASRSVMAELRKLSPTVEQLSIDEAFVDVTDVPGLVKDIARELQKTINDKLHLPCSIGAGTSKMIAKIATNIGKASYKGTGYPNALLIVPPGKEETFLAPLGVQEMSGIGIKTAEKLASFGIQTIGDLAAADNVMLAKEFGKYGPVMARRAKGIDNSPLTTSRQAKSISHERTFSRDTISKKKLVGVIQNQAQSVSTRLKKRGIVGKTVRLKLRWSNFTTFTRQVTLPQPVEDVDQIAQAAVGLLEQNWDGVTPIRLLGVGVSGLETPPKQLGLFDKSIHRELRLQKAIKEIESKLGENLIERGTKKINDKRQNG